LCVTPGPGGEVVDVLLFWCDGIGCEVIGRIRHHDPRGFLMTYLRAGTAVHEVFSFDTTTSLNPWTPDPSLLGFRRIAVATADPTSAARRLGMLGGRPYAAKAPAGRSIMLDPDGAPVELVPANRPD
jgi:hypothetical protein